MSSKRIELYHQGEIRSFLGELLSLGKIQIEPKISLDIRYNLPESNLNKLDFDDVTTLMNKLSDNLILNKKFYEKLILCPHCNGYSVRIRFVCTKCNSHDIFKGNALEHMKCGHVGLEDNFNHENRLICPKCKHEMNQIGVDYKRSGTWFKCRGCDDFFGEPTVKFYCDDCQKISRLSDIIFKDVYRYEINEQVKDELKENISYLDLIFTKLGKKDFKVQQGVDIKGQSGVTLSFDLLIKKGIKRTAIEFINQEATIDKILSIYAKSIEVDFDLIIAIVMSGIKDDVKLLAETYGIALVESNDPDIISEIIDKILSKK